MYNLQGYADHPDIGTTIERVNTLKIIIAMDSFKSSLKAAHACEIVKKALQSVEPALEILAIPMADGGEGTAEAMMSVCNGKWIEVQTMGPLLDMHIKSGFAFFPETNVALVEMAKASGLELLSPEQTTLFAG